MFNIDWITTTTPSVFMVIITTVALYVALVVLTRMTGLRSFSKMSSFDFALTVAVGSLFAAIVVSQEPPLVQGLTALASVYLVRFIVSWGRRKSPFVERTVDNSPLLLMAGAEILDDHLSEARVTRSDLRAKLRGAGVINPSEVLAVVFESSADISVMRKREGVTFDEELLTGVRGADRLLQKLPLD